MKRVKIIIPLVALVAIAFFVVRSLVLIEKVKNISSPRNQFIERIEKEIDSIGKLPDSQFSPGAYDHVLYLIEDFSTPNPPQYAYGRLGNSKSENDQWKSNLTRNIYAIYTGKFINQAFFVFHGSQWINADLNFIRSEYQTLRNSRFLEKGSQIDKKFTEIDMIFIKYDEINGFLSNCMRFAYSSYNLDDRFPISDVNEKIAKAATYRNNRLENQYVNNCTRLHDGLKNVPQVLFISHIRYLDNKINIWSNHYKDFKSQREYANLLYNRLKSEIASLDNGIYKVSNFDNEYQKLTDKLSEDNVRAYNYFK